MATGKQIHNTKKPHNFKVWEWPEAIFKMLYIPVFISFTRRYLLLPNPSENFLGPEDSGLVESIAFLGCGMDSRMT